MVHLDEALAALNVLRRGDFPDQVSAVQARDLARLGAAIQKQQHEPTNLEGLLLQTLNLRSNHPTAKDPAWRDLICRVAGAALVGGVPAPTVIQAIRQDQLVADMKGEPRLYGDPLVMVESGTLRLHHDVPQDLPADRPLN